MKSTQFLFFILILLSKGLFAQSIALRKVTTLPTIVQETSGIEATNPLYIWTHNDSGGEPELYKIDTFGTIIKTLVIKNAQNTDWEDITSDGNSYYIGDIGNNANSRKDLKIYKIPNPENIVGDTADAEIISFSYSNQNLFPPDNAHKNFDAEALVYFDSSLYIFSKNYTSPFTGYTYLYRMPSMPGQYIATLLDSFKTGTGYKEQWWVTAADISPDFKKLVLLSSDKLFVFNDFAGDDFFKGKVKTIDLGSFTQKEAIAFYNNNEFYLTDEYFDILGGRNLYQGSIKTIFTTGFGDGPGPMPVLIKFKKQLGEPTISLVDETRKVNVFVLDMNGKVVGKYRLDYTQPIVVMDLAAGYYTLLSNDGWDEQKMKILVE